MNMAFKILLGKFCLLGPFNLTGPHVNTWPDPEPGSEPEPEPLNHSSTTWKQRLHQQSRNSPAFFFHQKWNLNTRIKLEIDEKSGSEQNLGYELCWAIATLTGSPGSPFSPSFPSFPGRPGVPGRITSSGSPGGPGGPGGPRGPGDPWPQIISSSWEKTTCIAQV